MMITAKNVLSSRGAFDANLPVWVKDISKTRLDSVLNSGFPTRKSEDWKYTNLKKVSELEFKSRDVKELDPLVLDQVDVHYSSGKLSFDASALSKKFPKLRFAANDELNDQDKSLIQASLQDEDFSSSWNTAMLENVLVFDVPKGVRLGEALNFFIGSNDTERPRGTLVFINLNEDSEIHLNSEFHVGSQVLENFRFVFRVAKNAHVSSTRFASHCQEGFVFIRNEVEVEQNAQFVAKDFMNGAQIYRNEFDVVQKGEHSEAHIDGLYVGVENEHIDNFLSVHHTVPSGQSSQNYRGILDGNARAVFNGAVRVDSEAQLTNATQLNKTLMLSEKAEIDAKPQLQIDADDVKCGHGAAIVQLNPDEQFYLRSRGIPADRARELMIRGFSKEMSQKIKSPVMRERFEDLIGKRVLN